MDDMTLVTTTVPCISRILERLNKNLKWAGMISISRGKLSDRRFVIDEEKIPIPIQYNYQKRNMV